LFAVPELTRSAGIQLNARVLLRRFRNRIASSHRIVAFRPGLTQAKPPGDHIPPGGFVSFETHEVDRGVVYEFFDHLCGYCFFYAAVRKIFGETNRTLDLRLRRKLKPEGRWAAGFALVAA
jgi:hypothetical protein